MPASLLPRLSNSSPQKTVNRDGLIIGVEQVAEKVPGGNVVRRNRAPQAITNQQIVTEEPEILRSQSHAPGSTQPRAGLQASHQQAASIEEIDKTALFTAIVVSTGFAGILPGVGHHHKSTDGLDVVRSKIAGQIIVVKKFRPERHALEVGIKTSRSASG
jgi:hypothetical protein